MEDLQVDKIKSMSDELKELHPLLSALIPKMPNFLDSEYTQGNREMGADFVIARRDELFGGTDYVGVVAKIGKIHQDLSEVDRQIEECFLVPRLFSGGKDMISINHVWVIANGTITKGAQEKIHAKYIGRAITFIDARKLAGLVDKYLPGYWGLQAVQTGEYLTKVQTRHEEIEKSVNLMPGGNGAFYIEQDIYSFPRDEYRMKLRRLSKPARRVDILDVVQKEKITLIEGGMGSGKSKALRHITSHFANGEIFSDSKVLPIPLTFRELIDEFSGDIARVLQTVVSDSIAKELPADTQFLLIIDGIDEKKLSNEELLDQLKKVCRQIEDEPKLRAVFASRPLEALEKNPDLDKVISSYEIRPLSMSRTIEFLQRMCTGVSLQKRLIEDLKKSELFDQLPRSPIAVILLANIINENPRDLPSSLTELYAKYVEWTLGRWETEKGLQNQKEYEALRNVLMNLSLHLLEADVTGVSASEVKDTFAAYLNKRNLGVTVDGLFDLLMTRSEFMFENKSRGTIGFKHRTFAEFFYAAGRHRDRNMVIDNRALQPYWNNSVYFYIGLEKDIPEVISEISSLTPSDEREEIFKFLNMPNFLMAAYSSPYDVITAAVKSAIVDAASLYKRLINGGSISALAKLPRMHVLYLFQAIIRHNYSYPFFIKALEEAALLIDAESMEDETKAYALFFLNVAYIDSGAGESFDFLFRSLGTKLPLDIMLAYRHESENTKHKNDVMKRQDKRIRKILGNDKSLVRQVTKLYENPIGVIGKESKRRGV